MTYQTLDFSVENNVSIIRFNRPDAANGIDLTMAQELMRVAIACEENSEVRSILLTGNGKMFSAGGDLKSFAEFGAETSAKIKELMVYMHSAIARLARLDAPLIIAVNGTAAGAGFSLALSGDLVYASENAKFTMAYTAAGLSPDGSASYYLPRLVGLRRAQELMLTNRLLSADEAKDWGILTEVISADALYEHALTQAQKLAQGPSLAFGSVKTLLKNSSQNDLESQLELEAELMGKMSQTTDGLEGIQAFCEKRRPSFVGK